MRISSTMMSSNYLRQLNKTYEQYAKLMEQSDGNKLHRASDDAVGYSKYLRYTDTKVANEQFQENVSTATSWMTNSDAALVHTTELLITFKAKVSESANSYNNESDMSDIAKELLANVQEQVSAYNTQIGDRFLFSGTKDTTMPFEMTSEKMNRGETRTLDEQQSAFFSGVTDWYGSSTGSYTETTLKQMLKLNGDDGNVYYMNVNTGDVFTEDFVKEGYKDCETFDPTDPNQVVGNIATEVGLTSTTGGVTTTTPFSQLDHFDEYGVIQEGTSGSKVGTDFSANITVDGTNVELTFATTQQYIVKYYGDDNYISMVKKTGGVDQTTDTVNVTGQDINGCDIFDVGYDPPSGTAMLNQLLYAVAKIDSADYMWSSDEGMTLADGAHNTVLGAETKMAARQQSYEAASSMLLTQNETVTGSLSDVASTDVAYLATKLMEYQTIYSLSLSVGSRILPGTLADYL